MEMLMLLVTLLVGFCVGFIVHYVSGRTLTSINTIRRHPHVNAEIEKLLEPLKFNAEKLVKVKHIISEQLLLGLSATTHATADVKMFSSYVRHLPSGNENGDVMALDLGGTNFRVLRVKLTGDGVKPLVDSKVFMVPQSILKGSGEDLFDYLAECLQSFIESEGLINRQLSLGFTFSFPCTQHGLARAKLSEWTKGFQCSGVVGNDVVLMLQRAIDKKHLRINVTALINDTVGTLVACGYTAPQTSIGLIVGTGFNACYVERLSEVGTWDGDYNEPSQVIINTEWGALGSNGCLDWLLTEFDKEVDNSSVNKGRQILEKLVSGMYMGEIVRNVLISLIEKKMLFMNSVESYKQYLAALVTPGAFLAKYVSDIETDDGVMFEKTAMVMNLIGATDVTYEDCIIIRRVCKLVSKRAGALVAAGLACLIDRVVAGRNYPINDTIVIGVDGSLYRYHPKFQRNIEKPLNSLVGDRVRYQLMLSDDGSGIGAALIAHIDSIHSTRSLST